MLAGLVGCSDDSGSDQGGSGASGATGAHATGAGATRFDGAKPGLSIPSMPTVGQKYRQEYYACEAEDPFEAWSAPGALGSSACPGFAQTRGSPASM
jgi:hypothetical protein